MCETYDMALMWFLFFLDELLTVGVVIAEAVVFSNYDSMDDQPDRWIFVNKTISGLILGLSITTIISPFVAGYIFWGVAKQLTEMKKSNDTGHTFLKCHTSEKKNILTKGFSLSFYKGPAFKKILVIVLAALAYLETPYVMALAQVHVWSTPIVLTGQTLKTKNLENWVIAVNVMVYLIFALRLLELILGHAWAVNRTVCYDTAKSEEGKKIDLSSAKNNSRVHLCGCAADNSL